jgi:hypothetical protein
MNPDVQVQERSCLAQCRDARIGTGQPHWSEVPGERPLVPRFREFYPTQLPLR